MKWLLFAFCVVSIIACTATVRPGSECPGVLIEVGAAEVPKEYDDKIVITRKPVFMCLRPQDMIQAPKPKKKDLSV